MADLIATIQYACMVGESGDEFRDSFCCTKSMAERQGCTVKGNYADNQLVCKKDLCKMEWH